MSVNRTRKARRLAAELTERTSTPVSIAYRDSGDGHGRAWHIRWTDGPTLIQLLSLAAGLAETGATLDVAQLHPARSLTPVAEAAAVLVWLDDEPGRAELWAGLWTESARWTVGYPDRTRPHWQDRAMAVLSLSGAGRITVAACEQIDARLRADGWSVTLAWLDQISERR